MRNQDPTAGEARRPGTHRVLGLALLATTGLAAALACADQPARAPAATAEWPATMLLAQAGTARPAAAVQAELDALLKAAKAEGEVTFYISLTENVGKRVVDGFSAKYGIRTQFIRLTTAALTQRYLTEAEAGTHAADVVFNAGTAAPYIDTISKGWIEPISKMALPVITSGEYPAKFFDGNTAIVQIAPWTIAYNTNKVKGADIPKDWGDLLHPKWKGEVLVADTSVGTVYAEFWIFIQDRYGEDYFKKIAPNLRRYPGGVPAIQSLSAGEGSFQLPVPVALGQGPKDKGAPIAMVIPDLNTGLETRVVMTARAKSRHPNAARLLANYVLTPEGNKVFNNEPGGVTVYDTAGLPRQYESPKPGAAARVKEMATKLGF